MLMSFRKWSLVFCSRSLQNENSKYVVAVFICSERSHFVFVLFWWDVISVLALNVSKIFLVHQRTLQHSNFDWWRIKLINYIINYRIQRTNLCFYLYYGSLLSIQFSQNYMIFKIQSRKQFLNNRFHMSQLECQC